MDNYGSDEGVYTNKTDLDRLGSSSRPSDKEVVNELEQTYESDVKK